MYCTHTITRVQDEKNKETRHGMARLDTETIECAPAALERIHDIESGNGFPLCVFSIGYRVADDLRNELEKRARYIYRMVTHALKEILQYGAGLLVDEARNTLDTATTSETADSGLGNALDVVTEDFTMALSTSLSKTLATFSTASYKRLVSEE